MLKLILFFKTVLVFSYKKLCFPNFPGCSLKKFFNVYCLSYFRLKYLIEWNDDTEIVAAIVKYHGMSLEYASKRLKNNKDIALAAVLNAKNAILYASDELQNDPDIIQAFHMSRSFVAPRL